MSRTDSVSSHEFSVSWACTSRVPSLLENRASRASSIDTSFSTGAGSSARARPSRVISSPSPKATVTTTSPLISTKLVKLMPAATQYSPRFGWMFCCICNNCCFGSGAGPRAFIATRNGLEVMVSIVGGFSSRLMPKPMPMPVMKNAGGPPSGACSAPKAKNEA